MSAEEETFRKIMSKFDDMKQRLRGEASPDVHRMFLEVLDLNLLLTQYIAETRKEQLLESKQLFEIVIGGQEASRLGASNLDSRVKALEEKVKTMSDANGFVERTRQ